MPMPLSLTYRWISSSLAARETVIVSVLRGEFYGIFQKVAQDLGQLGSITANSKAEVAEIHLYFECFFSSAMGWKKSIISPARVLQVKVFTIQADFAAVKPGDEKKIINHFNELIDSFQTFL